MIVEEFGFTKINFTFAYFNLMWYNTSSLFKEGIYVDDCKSL